MEYKETLFRLEEDWQNYLENKGKLTYEDMVLIKELLLKKTPTKPLDDEPIIKIISGKEVKFIFWYKFCPSCKKILNPNPKWDEKCNYCPDCGQKLDWSELEND